MRPSPPAAQARASRSVSRARAVVIAAAILVVLIWLGVVAAIQRERTEALARANAELGNEAAAFGAQLQIQLLAVDQTLRLLQRDWQANPVNFDLKSWQRRAVVLSDVVLHLFVADATGVIRASTRPSLLGVDVSQRDYFKYESSELAVEGRMYIGPATLGLVTRQWQMNMARGLVNVDGAFDGVIGVSYDLGGLERTFGAARLGPGGVIALVGLTDGQVRVSAGSPDIAAGTDLRGAALFSAIAGRPDGEVSDPARLYAFHPLPGRDLALLIGRDRTQALAGSIRWGYAALGFAALMTVLIVLGTAALVRAMRSAERREALLAREGAALADANAELAAARAKADATAADLEATIAGMSDGVSMVDGDLRLAHWNDKLVDLVGVPREALRAGAPIADLIRAQARAGEFGDVDVETEVSRRLAIYWSLAQTSVAKIERVRPNRRAIEMRRARLPAGGFVTLYTDVTARKQSEDALRAARAMAEAASEAKSRFVAIVSHEIRTPLNTLLNSLRLLSETRLAPEQQHMAAMASQSGEALLSLLNDVLEMSRMEAGRLVVRPAPFALRPLLTSVVEAFRAEADARGVLLHAAMAPNVPDFVTTDPARVRQILVNLVGNAVKFTTPGAVWLRAGVTPGPEPSLLLTVADNGPPIAAEDRARLFLPFSQLDQAGASAGSGSGLGLAICQRLAALLGGEVGCDTTPGGGNAFWLSLKLNAVGAHPGALPDPRPRGPLPRTRILLVDDVAPSRTVMATLLRRQGHAVDVVGSGQDAVAAVGRTAYDVVLMDIMLPGMCGLEAARLIRALPGAEARVPIIAVTAKSDDEDRVAIEAAGIDGLIVKPVEPDTLADALATHVWRGRPSRPPIAPVSAPYPAPRWTQTPLLSEPRLATLKASLARDVLARLCEECLADFAVRLPAFLAALPTASLEAIEADSHAMAGMAGSYGLERLAARLRAVMLAARAGALGEARGEAQGLAADMADSDRALRLALSPQPTENAA